MSLWSAAKTDEYGSDDNLYDGEYVWEDGVETLFVYDTDDSGRQFRKRVQKPTDPLQSIMVKPKAGYEIRNKSIPDSALQFNGIVKVPEGCDSCPIHTNLTNYFNKNSANIRGLANHEKITESWGILKKDTEDGYSGDSTMPTECWVKLEKKEFFSSEEVKAVLNRMKEGSSTARGAGAKVPQKTTLERKSSMSSSAVAARDSNVGLNIEVANQTSSAGKEETSPSDRSEGEMMVWSFVDEEGTVGRQYALNEETKKQMTQIIQANPVTSAAQFFIETGITMYELFVKENMGLREQLSDVQRKLEQTRISLQQVTADRDARAQHELALGSKVLKEVELLRVGKAEAEARVAAYKEAVDKLGKSQEQSASMEQVLEKLSEIHISTKDLKAQVEAGHRLVSAVGAEKENRTKLFTPALEILSKKEEKIVFIALEHVFKKMKHYRSIGRDMDKMVKAGKLEKIFLEQKGQELGLALHKRKTEQPESGQHITLLVIDGAESIDLITDSVQKISLEYVATLLSAALKEDNQAGEVVLIAGSTTNQKIEEARLVIIEKMKLEMEHRKVSTLNMSALARNIGEEAGEKWEKNEMWTYLAVANFLSQIAWWSQDIGDRSADIEKAIGTCQDCGFFHENCADKCLKGDILEAERVDADFKEREEKKEKKPYNNNNNNKFIKRCDNCNKRHTDPCWHLPKKHSRQDDEEGNSGKVAKQKVQKIG